jgi:putative hemolysin
LGPVSWAGLGLIVTLTLASALLVLAENAALELSRASLANIGRAPERSTARLLVLLENRFRFWVSARMGSTILVFASAALAATTVGDELGIALSSRVGGVVLAIAILAVVHAGTARVAPRILAQRYPSQLSHKLSILIFAQYLLFIPATRMLERLLSPAEQQAWQGPDPEDEAVIEAVEEGAREGSIDELDVEMITNVIALGDRVARQVMTPRPDIVAVSVNTPLRDALQTAYDRGVSRLPVYDGDLDTVMGVIHVRDGLAALLEPSQAADLRTLVREPVYVPDSKFADQLFREMQAAKMHMVIVVNEYGDTAGLVTIEDLLEEIVGEIEDEYDTPEISIEPLGSGRAVVDAGLPITDLNQELDLNLPADDVDTVGGLAFSAFGRVPAVGDSVDISGATLRVHEIIENRITRLEIHRTLDTNDDENQASE